MRQRVFAGLVAIMLAATGCRFGLATGAAALAGAAGAAGGFRIGHKYDYTAADGSTQTSDQRPWFALAGFVMVGGLTAYLILVLYHPEAAAPAASSGSDESSSDYEPATDDGEEAPSGESCNEAAKPDGAYCCHPVDHYWYDCSHMRIVL